MFIKSPRQVRNSLILDEKIRVRNAERADNESKLDVLDDIDETSLSVDEIRILDLQKIEILNKLVALNTEEDEENKARLDKSIVFSSWIYDEFTEFLSAQLSIEELNSMSDDNKFEAMQMWLKANFDRLTDDEKKFFFDIDDKK